MISSLSLLLCPCNKTLVKPTFPLSSSSSSSSHVLLLFNNAKRFNLYHHAAPRIKFKIRASNSALPSHQQPQQDNSESLQLFEVGVVTFFNSLRINIPLICLHINYTNYILLSISVHILLHSLKLNYV